MRRVAITGAGTVNALGQDVAATYAAFKEGRSGIGPLRFRDVDKLAIRIGGQVHDWQPETFFDRQLLSLLDRNAQFALVAARQAVAQSGISFQGGLGLRSGVVLGTASGGVTTSDDSYRAVYQENRTRIHPFVVPRVMNNAAASHVSMEWGLQGPGFSVATACASSNHAMGLAFQMIRSGMADVMLTGGAEAMLCYGGLKAWEGLRVMSPDGCRPFSADRNGMVPGEGAAIFVFEEWNSARSRGAEILAEVAGFAMTSDAADIVMPNQTGAESAMVAALRDAKLNPSDIGYINAHGTGTAANDRTECAAIAEVFGPHTKQVMVSSTKSMHGHLIGATGAVELLACLLALRHGVIAPTIGHARADPDCALDVVPNFARQAQVSATLSNAFSFGGFNAVLALKKA